MPDLALRRLLPFAGFMGAGGALNGDCPRESAFFGGVFKNAAYNLYTTGFIVSVRAHFDNAAPVWIDIGNAQRTCAGFLCACGRANDGFPARNS